MAPKAASSKAAASSQRLPQRTIASRRAAEIAAQAAQAALQAETDRKARRAAEELAFEESTRRAQEEAALETAELRRLQDVHAARLSVGPKASPPTPPPQQVEECLRAGFLRVAPQVGAELPPPPAPVPETFAGVAAADEVDRRRQEAIRMAAQAMTPHPLPPPGVSFLADLDRNFPGPVLPTRREATESQAARDQADRDFAEWHRKQKERSEEAPAVPLPAPVPTPPAPAAAPREPRRTNADVRGVDMTPFWKTITHARERKQDGRPRIDTPGDQEMVDLGEHPPMPWSRPLEVELIVLGPAPAAQPAPPVEAEVDPLVRNAANALELTKA